jgi:hypothetical protein
VCHWVCLGGREACPHRSRLRHARLVWILLNVSNFDLRIVCDTDKPQLDVHEYAGVYRGRKPGSFLLCCSHEQFVPWYTGFHLDYDRCSVAGVCSMSRGDPSNRPTDASQDLIGDGILYTAFAGLLIIMELLILLVMYKGASWREECEKREEFANH